MNRSRHRVFAAGLALSALAASATVAGSVLGQEPEPPPSDIATARILGTEGLRLAEAGDCAAAVARLERAEALYHAPTTLGRLGECQVELGQIVAGTENLQRVVREQLAPNASPAFLAAKERAARALAEALPRIAVLRIFVRAPEDRAVTVQVDGVPVPPEVLGVDRPTDPGERRVVATAPSCDAAEQRVSLPEGGTGSVRLALSCNAIAKPVPPLATLPEPDQPPRASPQRDDTFAWVSLGVGAAGVVTGSVFGLLAMGNRDALRDVCDSERNCPTASQADLDALDRNALVSNVGFGVGLVGVALGTTLLILPQDDAPEAAARVGSGSAPGSIRASAWVGLGSAGVKGSF